ncbi:MAG: cupin domain-containing protein [Nitrospirae bacterium]|nr:cupin domain-containing protein [Candidatus Manganitrophaceae bacterium]
MPLAIRRWEKPGEPAQKVALEKELKAQGYQPEFWVDKPGTRYANRKYPAETVLWILRGEVTLNVGMESETLHDGDRIILPSQTSHTLQVLGDKPLLWLIAQKKKRK